MQITYLGHSGFLFETETAYYLFDYIRGDLPDFREDKKLYVFASHAHRDHWDLRIFTDPKLKNTALFVLGFDIQKPFEQMFCDASQGTREDAPGETSEDDPGDVLRDMVRPADLPVCWAFPRQSVHTEEFDCDFLLSTDEGVAFLVRTEKEVLYHAGDLNWWHWNGDPEERNLERAQNFKREIDRMKGIHIDAACVPLDPRQEDAYRFCMDYCLETLDADHVFPMHFWKKHALCLTYHESLKEDHPDWYGRFRPIRFEGETFVI